MPGPHCRGRAGAPDESWRPQRVTLTLLHLLAAVHGAGGGPHPLLHHHVLAATAPLAPPGAGQGVLPWLLQHGHSHRRSRRCAEKDILITRSCHCKSAAVSRWQHVFAVDTRHTNYGDVVNTTTTFVFVLYLQLYHKQCICSSSSNNTTTCVRGCGVLGQLLLLLHLLTSPGLLRTDRHLGPRMRSAATHLATSTEESLSVLLVLARLLRSPLAGPPPTSGMGIV